MFELTIPSSWTSVFICLVTCGLVWVHYFYKNKHSFWSKKGVKGPKPLPLFGNLFQMLCGNLVETKREWSKEYGKFYGYYLGTRPELSISDAEVFLQICIRDFDKFTDHQFVTEATKYQENFLVFLKGQRWKRVRAILSPTFTSGKIKRMFKLLEVCADDLLNILDRKVRKNENLIHLKDVYSLFTLDAITSCCYGLRIERGPEITDIKSASAKGGLAKAANEVFQFKMIRFLIASIFPKFVLKFLKFTPVSIEDQEPLAKIAEKLVEKRRSNETGRKFDDYLQILVDARLEDKIELSELDDHENHHAGLTEDSLVEDQQKMIKDTISDDDISSTVKGAKLEDLEIISSAMFLVAVGLETTATLLTNATYALAHHPELQEKLYRELVEIKSRETGQFAYEDITSCNYLDAVISETFRVLSPLIRTDRKANSDYYIEKFGIHIEEGQVIDLAIATIHKDPEYWPEPEKFNPDRFLPGQKEKIVPGSYCPFGIGPRHCLGMRFSLTEAKLALAKIMMKYRFEKAPNSVFPPPRKTNLGFANIKEPLVSFVERKD